jgi:phosphoglycerate dehydrogenase-like enzyme
VHKILVIDPRQKNVKLGWLGPEYNVVQPASYELKNIMEEIRDAEGILTAFRPVPSELMEAVPGLKVVARPGAGIDNIDVEAATRLGVRVCNVTGVRGRALAEHALFLMLYLARHAWMKDDPEGWEATPPIQLTGRTMGVVGLGDIGRNVVKIGHGFGLEILVNTRTPDPCAGGRHRVCIVREDVPSGGFYRPGDAPYSRDARAHSRGDDRVDEKRGNYHEPRPGAGRRHRRSSRGRSGGADRRGRA